MTGKEKKLVALGAGAGVLTAGIAVAIVISANTHTYAAEQPMPESHTTRPSAGPGPETGTQPGTQLQLTPAEMTAAGVQVAEVRTAALNTSIPAFGRVEQPEAQLGVVSARVGGRVDRLYVQYTGESVRRGQPVAEIYSPEASNAIADYRLARETRSELTSAADSTARTQADALVSASARKLALWGINEKQAVAPEPAVPHVTIYSSAGGTVVERKVTQGQYVNAGDTLFTVADLSQVWIKADVYEDQLPQIRRGQQVEITTDALPNRTLHGQVDFIEPAANPQTRTVPVHVHVANPGMRLLPGMFVNANFVSRGPADTIVVPRSAVLDTGTRKIVYIAKPDGVFEAREVALGTPADDLFPVLSGLTRGEQVVLSGNFLIDSQAHLSSGMSGLYGGSKEFASAPAASAAQSASTQNATLTLHPPASLKSGEDNAFSAVLIGADGKPIPDAQVKLTLVMPAMASMGMPEMKSSSDLAWSASQKAYIGKAQPGMAGGWNVTVEARRQGAVIATYRTRLIAR
jgi:RND family efflux transporter MFP subunit